MKRAPECLRVKIENSGRIFEGPTALVTGEVIRVTAGAAPIDVSDYVGILADGLDRDLAYQIEFGGKRGDAIAEKTAAAFLDAGLTEITDYASK